MPNAGASFEKARQGTMRRAARAAASPGSTATAAATPSSSDKPQQPAPRQQPWTGSSWKHRAKEREWRYGHRSFFLVQVVVAVAVMVFCMTQLQASQKQRLDCEQKGQQNAANLIAAAQVLKDNGINVTREIATTIVDQLSGFGSTLPPAAAQSPPAVPLLALLAAKNLTVLQLR
jgi:hypothetical protein